MRARSEREPATEEKMERDNEPVDKSQIDKFRRVAAEIGCYESEDAFKERLGKLLGAPAPRKDDDVRKSIQPRSARAHKKTKREGGTAS
jgi:hypothetical protein